MKKVPYIFSFALVMVVTMIFSVNDSFATDYKSGWATFENYFTTNSFYLPKGTYTYKDKSYTYGTKKGAYYKVCIYKGSSPSNCEKDFFAPAKVKEGHSAKFKISSAGNYKIRFEKTSGSGTVQIDNYRLAK